jgi:cbb3-type cytochrome oxidase subunit 1
MTGISLKFVILAALSLVIGVSLGIYMGIAHDFLLVPVHAHLNLVGWASLALFGIVYHLMPQMAERRIAKLHFLLAAPSAILLPAGIAMSVLGHSPMLAIIASLVWFAGAILFLVQLLAILFAVPAAPVPAE